MSGEWVLTTEGRYVYDQGDGWYFDHLDQQWYMGDVPPSTPTGAPAAARAKRTVAQVTERPQGVFMAGATAYRDGFCGFLAFLIGWACRGGIVLGLGWIVLHAGAILRGFDYWGRESTLAWRKESNNSPEILSDLNTATYALVVLVGVFFLFLLLVILSLNPTQSAALTSAFVAHRMYRHFVQDIGQAQVHAAEQYARSHPGQTHRHHHGSPW